MKTLIAVFALAASFGCAARDSSPLSEVSANDTPQETASELSAIELLTSALISLESSELPQWLATEDQSTPEEVLDYSASTLETLFEATREPDLQFPIDKSLGFDVPLLHIEPCRRAHDLAMAQTRAAIALGERERVLIAAQVSVAMSEIVSRDGVMLSSLLASKMAWDIVSCIADARWHDRISNDDAAILLAEFKNFSAPDAFGFFESMDFEYESAELLLDQIASEETAEGRFDLIDQLVFGDEVSQAIDGGVLGTDAGLDRERELILPTIKAAQEALRAALAEEDGADRELMALAAPVMAGDRGHLSPMLVTRFWLAPAGAIRVREAVAALSAMVDGSFSREPNAAAP